MRNYKAARSRSALFGLTALAVIVLGCAPHAPVVRKGEVALTTVLPPAGVIHIYQRKTRGVCPFCLVHVAVTAPYGPLPDPRNPPASPVIVGYLSNVGEGGRHEKRYDLKPSSEAEYELELSNDMGRTRWTIYEKPVGSSARRAHRTGHLEGCEYYPHAAQTDIGFKDCPRSGIRYDSLETAAFTRQPLNLAFANYASEPSAAPYGSTLRSTWMDLIAVPPYDEAPAWISCTYGCCTLAM